MRWSLTPRSAKSQGKGKRLSRRHRLDRWRFPLVVELLEERTLLATIQWINPAGGDWGVAANWDLNRVPQAADDVVINVGGNGLVVTHAAGSDTVNSLNSQRNLTVTGGSALTVTGGFIEGVGETLKADNGAFTANGAASLDGASLIALAGGAIHLPGATSYTNAASQNDQHRVFEASGAGSALDLPHVATVTNGVYYDTQLLVEALAGASVNLSGLTTIRDGNGGDSNYRHIDVTADGAGSVVDLSALTTFTSSPRQDRHSWDYVTATRGGTVRTPALQTLVAANVTWDPTAGTLAFPVLVTLNNSALTVSGGAVSLPALATVQDTTVTVTGVSISLPAAMIDGSGFIVQGGGGLALPMATSYTNASYNTNDFHRFFQAAGAGSVLDLSHLTTITNGTNYNTQLYVQAQAGGTVNLGSMTRLVDGTGGDTQYRVIDLDPTGGTIAAGTIELATAAYLTGTGTVMANVLNSGGVVEPSGSPGILQISGDYTQTANGSLTTDIGGPGGGQFGRFAVSGTAGLGGTLNINLVNNYYPANGLAFQILSAGTLTNRFATINGLIQHQQRTFQITYRATNFALVTVLDDLYPDLQAAALDTTPASGLHSGSNLTIHWNDTNTGKAATPTGANWSDRVVVRNLTTGQTLLNTTVVYDAVGRGPIAVNGSQAQQLAFTLPAGNAGAGMIEITVTVNTFNDVFEFNNAGTADSNNAATVSKTSVLVVPSPDLQVVNLAATFAAARQSGAGVVVSWDDANRGDAATSGSFYDTVVVTNTTTGKTIGQVALLYNEAASGNGPIAAGDRRSRQVTLTLPDGPDSVGTLSFTVTADAFN